MVHVMAMDEEYKISCFNLKNLCRQKGVIIESRNIGEVETEGFVGQINSIVD